MNEQRTHGGRDFQQESTGGAGADGGGGIQKLIVSAADVR
jgi:hypothetical protein